MNTWSKSIVTGLLTGTIILGSLPAWAHPPGPWFDRRAVRQEHRFDERCRPGRLTPGEFRRLEHQQQRIRMAEARMWADGHLDHWERARLRRMQYEIDRSAYRYSHNNWPPAWY
jgi:hypothetical protein